jgi:RecB family exonuclease
MTAGHVFGGTLHRTLEAFHREGAQAPVDGLLETYRTTWTDVGYTDADEAARHFEAGAELLRRYHALAREAARETIAVETSLRCDTPAFTIFGKIDRLDRLTGGELQVIDYKSGRMTITERKCAGARRWRSTSSSWLGAIPESPSPRASTASAVARWPPFAALLPS